MFGMMDGSCTQTLLPTARLKRTVMSVQSCIAHLAGSNRCTICNGWRILWETGGIYWKCPLGGHAYELVTISAGRDESGQVWNLLSCNTQENQKEERKTGSALFSILKATLPACMTSLPD